MYRIYILAFCIALFGCKPELAVEIPLPGTVVSDDGTIDCPRTCTREVTGRQIITLTASEVSLFYPFHHWEGACSGTDPVCEIELDPSLPYTVKAQFAYKGKKLGEVEFDDPNLEICIKEAKPNWEYNSTWVYYLDCSNREIASLSGVEELGRQNSHFNFDNNTISDITPLIGHRFTEGLYLRNNMIIDPLPLSEVDVTGPLLLEGNPNIDCDAMHHIADNYLPSALISVPQCGITPQSVDPNHK